MAGEGEFAARWAYDGPESALEWSMKQHDCAYGAPVILADGTYTWSCDICGDVQTCSKEMYDRIQAAGMRAFDAAVARDKARKAGNDE